MWIASISKADTFATLDGTLTVEDMKANAEVQCFPGNKDYALIWELY
jgi:hypothetical protein